MLQHACQSRNAETTCVQYQQHASNTTPATCKSSVVVARSLTRTTAVQQEVQHIQAADAGEPMFPPPVSLLDGRVFYIVQRMIPGTRYELFTHIYLKNCTCHMYTHVDVIGVMYQEYSLPGTRPTYKRQDILLLSVEAVHY